MIAWDKLETMDCGRCEGSGKEPSQSAAVSELQHLKSVCDLPYSTIAKRMSLSKVYVFDLINGNRSLDKETYEALVDVMTG